MTVGFHTKRRGALEPNKYRTLENLGVAVIDAQGESNIAPMGGFFKSLAGR
jgi:putative ATP-dependent endonuclease of OLD family